LILFFSTPSFNIRGEKKTKKSIKPRKSEKITEKTEPWRNLIKLIKILKNQPVRFRIRFYKSETKKNRVKPEKTEPNRFEPVSVKNFYLVVFFIKTELNRKWSPHSTLCWLRIWLWIFFICFLWGYHGLMVRVASFARQQADLGFLGLFLIDFFSVSSFNIELIENSTLFFSLYGVILVSWFGFGKLT